MSLTIEQINQAKDQDELMSLLSSEMSVLMENACDTDNSRYLEEIRALPNCFWAMGCIYHLDVSIALDDLGWHFANHYNWRLAQETLLALREVGANKEAELFEKALSIAEVYWQDLANALTKSFANFIEWYDGSELEQNLEPLNDEFYKLMESNDSLLNYILEYAKAKPAHALSLRSGA